MINHKSGWISQCAVIVVFATGCRDSSASVASAPAIAVTTAGTAARVAIRVDAQGYHPTNVAVRAGQPVTLVVTRTSDEGCGQQIVFPSLNIRRDLPLNQAVEIAITPAAGTMAFTCGMGMMRGSVVAQ